MGHTPCWYPRFQRRWREHCDILPRERVHPVDVSFTTALKVFTKWGTGAGEFVRAMASASPRGNVPTHQPPDDHQAPALV